MEHDNLEIMKNQLALSDKMETAGTNLAALRTKQNKVISAMREHQKNFYPGYVIAFDNIDIHVKCRHMSLQAQNMDVHWVNHIMFENRVSGNCLSTNSRNPADIQSIFNINFFLSIENQKQQRLNYIILVSRIMVEHFDAFSIFKDVFGIFLINIARLCQQNQLR